MIDNNSIAVYGTGANAASLALRRVFKSSDTKSAIIILDYTGFGAISIDVEVLKKVRSRNVVWIDLANRFKPTLLFSIKKSHHFKRIFTVLLQCVRDVSSIHFSDSTLEWAVEVAYFISEEGEVNLLVLLQILSNNSSRKWFLDTQLSSPDDFSNLILSISWAVSFPSVFALSSTSSNYLNIEDVIKKKQILWLEIRMEHFEYKEWKIVCCMAELAVENAIMNMNLEKNKNITVVHVSPPLVCSSGFSRWIKPNSDFMKNVGIFSIFENKAPGKTAIEWSKEADFIWIIGKMILDPEIHKCWLKEKTIETIAHNDAQSVVIYSNKNDQTVVARIKKCESESIYIKEMKFKYEKNLSRSSVSQMGSAVDFSINLSAGNSEIYKKLCEKDILRIGWFKISDGNKMTKGADNISLEVFKKNLEYELEKLSNELKTHCYKPRPLKKFTIKKADGSDRVLGIVSIRDKVVQSTFLYLVEPYFEPHFSQFSFAFRPGRSAIQAVNMVKSKISSGCEWVVTADIYKCFDSLDHDFLLSQIEYRINEPEIIDLMNSWITVETINFKDFHPQEVGVAQGSSISPLMANIYLDQLDKHFERLGIDFVRYADDIIVFAGSEEKALKSLEIMESFLKNPLHLELKPAKTNYSPIAKGFDFLGFRFNGEYLEIQQKKIERTNEKLLKYLSVMSNANNPLIERLKANQRLGALIRGFRNYFFLPGEIKIKDQLVYLDGQLDQMALRILPDNVRDDPLWICHERFFSELMEEENRNIFNRVNDIYSEKTDDKNPAVWMCKEENTQENPKNSDKTNNPDNLAKQEKILETIVNVEGRLSVFTNGSYLTIDGEDIVVKKKKKDIYRLPIEKIEILFIQGIAMNISVSLQIKLSENDIPVVFSPSTGQSFSVLNPVKTKNSFVRGLQILRRNDHDIIIAGLNMLSSKVSNQASVLRYLSPIRKPQFRISFKFGIL